MAEFVAGAVSPRDMPHRHLPEIVMAGRSNVGKSSLINKLTGSRKIARTGQIPGTTRSINFYRVEGRFMLVDLPGYGYARAGRAEALRWKKVVEQYLRNRDLIALVVHLVDARLAPTPLDHELERWLDYYGIPRLIVATKADKLSGNGRSVQERIIRDAFGQPVVLCSAVTGLGCREIWKRMVESVRDLADGRSPAAARA